MTLRARPDKLLTIALLPNGVPFRWITPGSVAAILIWTAASSEFRFYVTNVGRYNVVYGSSGAIIVLLLFFYISLALLIGGELNAVLAVERPPRAPRPAEPAGGEHENS